MAEYCKREGVMNELLDMRPRRPSLSVAEGYGGVRGALSMGRSRLLDSALVIHSSFLVPL